MLEIDKQSTGKTKRFFKEEEQLLSNYGQVIGLTIREGDKWSFDSKKGVIIYDKNWLKDQGFSPAQVMTATLHQIEELREFRRNPKLFEQSLAREEYLGNRFQVLHTCLQDILIDNTLSQRARAHKTTIRNLYKNRFFPEEDYQNTPRHLQFAYTILRESMLPKEQVKIDPKVREAIEGLKNINGKNLIKLISQPG